MVTDSERVPLPSATPDVAEADGPERNETVAERIDRNWAELLQELRVVQTGVQIFAGFLFVLPFQPVFAQLVREQQAWFVGTMLSAGVTMGLVFAPVVMHRIMFRRHEKDILLLASDVLAKTGLAFLALTLASAFGLVVSVVADLVRGIGVTVGMLCFLIGLWVVLPRVLMARHPARERYTLPMD